MKYITTLDPNIKVPLKPKEITNLVPESYSQIDKNWETILKMRDMAAEKGLNDTQIASLLGNIAVETGGSFNPAQRQYDGGKGRGLIQMEIKTPRYNKFLKSVKNPTDFDEQYNYILDTFKKEDTDNSLIDWGGYNRQDAFMKQPNMSLEDSTALLTKLYFRPKTEKAHTEERRLAAKYIAEKLKTAPKKVVGWMPVVPVTKAPLLPTHKKGGWLQKAVNPAHKGFCTPMTKETCTPRRKALAKRFKSGEFKKHQQGGVINYDISNILEQWKK